MNYGRFFVIASLAVATSTVLHGQGHYDSDRLQCPQGDGPIRSRCCTTIDRPQQRCCASPAKCGRICICTHTTPNTLRCWKVKRPCCSAIASSPSGPAPTLRYLSEHVTRCVCSERHRSAYSPSDHLAMMVAIACWWIPEPFGAIHENRGKGFAGTRSGSGLQEELSTNPLFFQHFPAVAPETLDRRGSADTFGPGPPNQRSDHKTQTT